MKHLRDTPEVEPQTGASGETAESRRSRRERREREKRRQDPGLKSAEALTLVVALICLLVLFPLRGALETAPIIPFLAAFTLFMIPGFLLARLVLGETLPGAARLPVALALSTGIFGLPGVAMLVLHRSFELYLWICAGILATALGLALYRVFQRETRREREAATDEPHSRWLWVPFSGLAAALAYSSVVNVEGPNGDRWIYLAYVRDYIDSGSLALNNPFLGSEVESPFLALRTTINGWLLEQSALSKVTGIEPVDLVPHYLSPTLVVLSLLSVYTLGRTLFGREAALLAATFAALFFMIDLHSTITSAFMSPGHDLMARATEDKFLTRFVFLPVALSLAALYLRERRLRYLAVFTFICWSVAAVHLIGLMLIGICTAGLGFFHLATRLREGAEWKSVLGLGTAISSVAAPPLVYLIATGSPLLSRLSFANPETVDSLVADWAASQRLLVLGEGSYIMHPALLLNPAILMAYVLGLPFLAFHVKDSLPARLLLGVMVFTPAVIYFPPLATLLAQIIGPWALVRLSWPISLAAPLVLGWIAWETLAYVRVRLGQIGLRPVRLAGTFLPLLLVIGLMAAAAPVAVAGLRSADERGETPQDESSCMDPTFRWMQGTVTETGKVLAPYKENSCIPAYSKEANVVGFRENVSSRAGSDLKDFFDSDAIGKKNIETLLRQEVDYVLLPADSTLNIQLAHLPGFSPLQNPGGRYRMYEVDRKELDETGIVAANSLLQDGELDAAIDSYLEALGGSEDEQLLAYVGLGLASQEREEFSDAAFDYEQAISLDPDEPVLYSLLSKAHSAGEDHSPAVQALRRGISRLPENVALRTELVSLLLFETPEEAVEEQRAVTEMFPRVLEYRVKLGTALAISGRDEAADREFERAIRQSPLSDRLHADVAVGNQLADRKEEALRHYERALELNPSSQTHNFTLGKLYASLSTEDGKNEEYFEKAERRLKRAIELQSPAQQGAVRALAWVSLGNLYRDWDRDRDAMNAYQEALKISPGLQEPRENLEKLR